MENIKHIDQAIFDLGEQTVVKRRKSIISAIAVLAAGMAMVVASMMPAVTANENLHAGIMFLGWALLAAGVIWALTTLFGSGGRVFYLPTREFLKRTEMFYDAEHFAVVAECVRSGDFKRLAQIEGGVGASVMVVFYQGRKGGVTICQLFRYIPHSYEPQSEMLVFEK